MKKLLVVLLTVLMVLGLAACGSKKTEDVSTTTHKDLKVYSVDTTDLGLDLKVENGTWAETYDALISLIKNTKDAETRYALMHKAEDLLMSTGAICPLYFYTDLFMCSSKLKGFYSTPLGFKYFMYTTLDDGGETLSLSIASEPATLDPALNSAVDGGTMLAHLFQGLATWKMNDKGNAEVAPDAIEALVDPVENEDGTATYTYTLREGLKWSDGQEVKASDYEYAWKRAAGSELGADYGYMFEVIKGYPDNLCVVADDAARTLTVTLNQAQAYWNELLAFPTFYPVRKDVVENESWATDPATYVCNGAYTIADWTHDSVITLAKNENYIDADKVTMPTLKFYLCDDANTMLTNFKNGDWLFIDDVPTNEIATLKEKYPNEFIVSGQIGTYYVIWNVNESILPADSTLTAEEAEKAQAEIRNAVALLFDRNYIVNDIAQGGQVPASSFVAMGIKDTDGNEFYKNAGDKNLPGYYNVSADAFEENCNKAIEVLKKYYAYDEASGKFTNFPTMTYLYNTSEGHKAIGEYLQSALANIGITMNMENQEWATFLETRKAGDFSIARNGWLADYSDPISFLDMWVSGSGNNDAQFGR